MEKPIIVQKQPYVLDTKAGKYAWCSCGISAKQPFCDGSHKGSAFVPKIVEVSSDQKIAWCGCKNSKNSPFCDGSHSNL